MKRHEQMGNSINTAAPSSKDATALKNAQRITYCTSAHSYASTNDVVNLIGASHEKDLQPSN